MAVKIRLKRIGAKKSPFYRVIVADERSPRNGKFIEELGYYNPMTDPADIKIDAEKATKWIANGAQPTDTVRALLKKSEILTFGETGTAMDLNLKQILTDIARAIVDTPDAVRVEETVDGDDVELVLSVAEDDTGMVIGRHGKIAKAIRQIMKVAAAKAGKHVNVEIK